jgi:hypothetical protein
MTIQDNFKTTYTKGQLPNPNHARDTSVEQELPTATLIGSSWPPPKVSTAFREHVAMLYLLQRLGK